MTAAAATTGPAALARGVLAVLARGLLAVGTAAGCAPAAADRGAPHGARNDASGALPTAAPDAERFLAAAREGTRRYRSLQAAVDDGFTRVGGEFPAMGEHWVSYARVMEGAFDAARPPILIYVNGADGPRLVGVAYTALRAGREAPPAFPGPGAWHEHNGEVGEESLPLRHSAHAGAAADAPVAAADAPRLFVLHAWVWTANPGGAFVTDNWALPFARAGVEPPVGAHARGAACALALAGDGGGYYRTTVRTALALSAREDSAAARVVARRRKLAGEAARPVRAAGRLATADAARLAAECDALWADLASALPGHADALRRLRGAM